MLDYNKHCHKDHLERIKRDWLPCPECDSCFRNEAGLDQVITKTCKFFLDTVHSQLH